MVSTRWAAETIWAVMNFGHCSSQCYRAWWIVSPCRAVPFRSLPERRGRSSRLVYLGVSPEMQLYKGGGSRGQCMHGGGAPAVERQSWEGRGLRNEGERMVGWLEPVGAQRRQPGIEQECRVRREARRGRRAEDARRTSATEQWVEIVRCRGGRGQAPGHIARLHHVDLKRDLGIRHTTRQVRQMRPVSGPRQGAVTAAQVAAACALLWRRCMPGIEMQGYAPVRGIGVVRLGSAATAHKAAIFARSLCDAGRRWPHSFQRHMI